MSSPDLTLAFVKMVLSLAAILALLWAVHRWMRRSMPSGRINAKGRLIKVLASNHLGVKKSIALVQVPGSVLVLGVGTEQISLLKSIDDPDLIAEMVPDEPVGSPTGSFADQLQRITRNFMGSEKSSGTLNDPGEKK